MKCSSVLSLKVFDMKKNVVFKFESMSCVDGEGLRCVVFMQGCPLRCSFCHNPEGWDMNYDYELSEKQLTDKILRYKTYIKQGGVTFSGGEPLLHAPYLSKVTDMLHEAGINVAVETSGAIQNAAAIDFTNLCDCVIFDLKGLDNGEYAHVTKAMSFDEAVFFLNMIKNTTQKLWVRCVIIPSVNDTKAWALRLVKILAPYAPKKVELLPFRKLCVEKYNQLGLSFAYDRYPEAEQKSVDQLQKIIMEQIVK